MFLSYLIFIFPAVAVLSAILYLPFYFVQRKKYGKRPFSIHFANYGLITNTIGGLIGYVLFYLLFMRKKKQEEYGNV